MKAMAVIGKRQGEEKRGLVQMAAEVGVTKSYLCRVFKKTMGMTVGEYIREFEKGEKESVIE
jgi:methylphosphotriester-DNA--protein-cysteine methyltransferase